MGMITETETGPARGVRSRTVDRPAESKADQPPDSSRLASGGRSGRPAGRSDLGGRDLAAGPIVIELSRAQVDRVLRDASAAGGPAAALAGLGDLRSALQVASSPTSDSNWHEGRLSTSLLRGLLVLSCLPADGGDVAVTEVARTLGLSASTTHRYVATLTEIGLAERDPTSRKYRRVTI